jgi:hypothetical protein
MDGYYELGSSIIASPSPVWCTPRNRLGPLLFLTYINDMPEMVKSSETKLFSDDNLLFRTINNQADSVLLQNDLTSLQDWEYSNLCRRRWCDTLSNAFAKSSKMISTCEPFPNFDAISWMVTMSWDSHDRFLRNPCHRLF